MSETTLDQEPIPVGHPNWRVRLRSLLVAGLLVLTPVAVTAFILSKLFELMEALSAPLIARAFDVEVPGLGVLLTLVVILILGWLSTNVLGRQLIHLVDRLVGRIPVGRKIYAGSKSVLQAISHRKTDAFKRVVLVEYPRKGILSMAFVTGRIRWPQIHQDVGDALTLFLPTTPNPTTGYLLLVSREQVYDLPMSVEEGVRMVISGGILTPELLPQLPSEVQSARHEAAT